MMSMEVKSRRFGVLCLGLQGMVAIKFHLVVL